MLHRHNLVRLTLLLIILAFLLEVWCLRYLISPSIPYTLLFTCIDSLLMGAIAAMAFRWWPRTASIHCARWLALVSFVTVLFYTLFHGNLLLTPSTIAFVTPTVAVLFASVLFSWYFGKAQDRFTSIHGWVQSSVLPSGSLPMFCTDSISPIRSSIFS